MAAPGGGRRPAAAHPAPVPAIEQAGRERGATELELHAQVQALGFYERLGYSAEGPEYPDAGIPHTGR